MANPSRNQMSDEIRECPLLNGGDHADVLLEYCGRKLAPAVMAEVDRHIAACAACRAFAESQAAVWSALDAFDAMPVSDDFDRKLFARIEREGKPGLADRVRGWFALTPNWKPAIPVAVAVTVLGVGLWLDTAADRTGAPVVAPVVAKTDKIDAEQLEAVLEDIEMLREFGVVEALGQRQM